MNKRGVLFERKSDDIYIVVFALMSVLSRLFNRWVFERILESANLKWEDVLNRRKELQGLDKQPRKMTSWILSVSPDRKETKKWFNIYNLINLRDRRKFCVKAE